MANKIGIDFGTTKTMVSYFNPTTGLVELVRLDQTRDSSSVFTTVHADESGNYLFGEDADEQAETDPKGYCRAFKLHLGETEPCLKRTSETAEDLATRFLRYIKEECEQTVFHGEPIETTTITVPVKFSPARKEALRRAAKAAGFQSVVFLPEPEAAGSAFLRDNPADKFSRALVLDWGGGTLDIAIISRGAGGTIRADRRCVEGRDKRIGGEVVDYLLLEHFKQIWLEAFEHPLVPSEEKEPALLRRVRKTKFALTGKPIVIFQPSPKEKVEISRERFSQIIEPLLGTAVELVQSALSKNKELGNPEPDAILLIGGTTLSPVVRETMEKNFPNLRVLSWHHSREAVALGATSLPDEAKSTSEPSRKDEGLVLSSETSFQVDLRDQRTNLLRTLQSRADSNPAEIVDSKTPSKGGEEIIFRITDEVLALANKVAICDKPVCPEERQFLENALRVSGSAQAVPIAWDWWGNKPEWQMPGAIVLAESAAKSLGFREEALSECHRFLVELSECDGAMTPNEASVLQLVDSKFREINKSCIKPKEGMLYEGTVTGVEIFGAFVEILPGIDGLCHISEFSDTFLKSMDGVCKVGDKLWVKCIGVDDLGRIKLSRRAALAEMPKSYQDNGLKKGKRADESNKPNGKKPDGMPPPRPVLAANNTSKSNGKETFANDGMWIGGVVGSVIGLGLGGTVAGAAIGRWIGGKINKI